MAEAPLRVFLSYPQELRDFPREGSFVAAAEEAVRRTGNVVVSPDGLLTDIAPAAALGELMSGADALVALVGFGSARELDLHEVALDLAARAGLPRLVFMVAEDATPPPRSLEDDRRLAAFRSGCGSRPLPAP